MLQVNASTNTTSPVAAQKPAYANSRVLARSVRLAHQDAFQANSRVKFGAGDDRLPSIQDAMDAKTLFAHIDAGFREAAIIGAQLPGEEKTKNLLSAQKLAKGYLHVSAEILSHLPEILSDIKTNPDPLVVAMAKQRLNFVRPLLPENVNLEKLHGMALAQLLSGETIKPDPKPEDGKKPFFVIRFAKWVIGGIQGFFGGLFNLLRKKPDDKFSIPIAGKAPHLIQNFEARMKQSVSRLLTVFVKNYNGSGADNFINLLSKLGQRDDTPSDIKSAAQILENARSLVALTISQNDFIADSKIQPKNKGTFQAQLNDLVDKKALTEQQSTRLQREIDNFKDMHPYSHEWFSQRKYLEEIFSLPWESRPIAKDLSMKELKKRLDQEFTGLDQVKDRILDIVYKIQTNPNAKPPMICLVGRPGAGKTTLAGIIADVLGKEFVKVNLAGASSEQSVKGFERGWVNARMGKILGAMKESKSNNPVMLLDEIDKLGTGSHHGNPQDVMLEVVNPEQNRTFTDNYLDMPYDLSNVMMVATANDLSKVPPTLRDRMEIIEIPTYSTSEKMKIAREHIIPRIEQAVGKFKFTDEALRELILNDAAEGGMRGLEKKMNIIAESLNRRGGKRKPITAEVVREILGSPKFYREKMNGTPYIGRVNVMWYSFGALPGGISPTDVKIFPQKSSGKGDVGLQLPTVLDEVDESGKSARLRAYYLVQSHCRNWKITKEHKANLECEFGIQLTENATVGDLLDKYKVNVVIGGSMFQQMGGPSGGTAIAVALASALTGFKIPDTISITGETNLRGEARIIGGLREKAMGAQQQGVKTIYISKENLQDVKEIPQDVKAMVDIEAVDSYLDILKHLQKTVPGSPQIF